MLDQRACVCGSEWRVVWMSFVRDYASELLSPSTPLTVVYKLVWGPGICRDVNLCYQRKMDFGANGRLLRTTVIKTTVVFIPDRPDLSNFRAQWNVWKFSVRYLAARLSGN